MRPIRLSQIARWCDVTHVAVFKWVRAGRLRAYRTPGGQYRVLPRECRGFLESYGVPVPEDLQRATGRGSCLIVEDDLAFAELLARQVRDATGWDVHVTADAVDACLRIGVVRPALVVLDLYLPGLDGTYVCRRIREHPMLAQTRIVAVTADPRDEAGDRLRQAGADAVLVKPFPFEALCRAGMLPVGRRGRPEPSRS